MLTLVAAAFTVASVFLAGRKNIWAWPLGLAGAALWVMFALDIGDTGVLLMNGFFCFLYVYNFITWKGFTMPTLFGQAARVKREKSRIRRRLRESEEARQASQELFNEGFFAKFAPATTPTNTSECDMSSSRLQVERDDSLHPGDFIPCEVCGCSLLFRDAFTVEHVAPDFHRFLTGHVAPSHWDVLPFDIKFYCKKDALPYHRIRYVYQRGGENTQGDSYTATVYVEFYKRVVSIHNQGYDDARELISWEQVTENGEQYD